MGGVVDSATRFSTTSRKPRDVASSPHFSRRSCSRSPRAAATTRAAAPTTDGDRGKALKVGADHRRRPAQRPRLQPARLRGVEARGEGARDRRPRRRVAPASDYVPNMTTLARQGYDVIIGVGFAQGDAIATAAKTVPRQEVRDHRRRPVGLKGKPANVVGMLFREEQVGYLAGYLAALEAKRMPGPQVISSVGGYKEPPVDRFIAGYQAGAKGGPGIKTLNGYSSDWDDQAKCKELALNQIQAGSKVVFQVAGGCGLGALDAARERRGVGDRRRRRPVVPRPAGPDERAEEGRRGRLPDDQERPGRRRGRADATSSSASPRTASGSARSRSRSRRKTSTTSTSSARRSRRARSTSREACS